MDPASKSCSVATASTQFSKLRRTSTSCIPKRSRSASRRICSDTWRSCTSSAPSIFSRGSPFPRWAHFAMTNFPTPLALVAELTHRCPLHCVYCSNPLELQSRDAELSTQEWSRVFREAAQAGVLQADFTGGEPLARPDIVELVRAARSADLYVSLITSGLPLDEARLGELVAAGLDHFQL